MNEMLVSTIIVVLLILFLSSTAISVWAVNKLSNLIYDIEEQVEESLDIIDSSYREIGKVLETPVFYDDPIVKQTLSSIRRSQSALLLIANKISNISQKKKEE